MNLNERELLEDLRTLASERRCEAPVRVEEMLLTEFRRRSRLRRKRVWASSVGVGAIAAAMAVLVWIGPSAPKTSAPPESPTIADDAASSFYPLPEADALPPLESALVVRVQLPMASLQLIGFPIDEERAGDRVEADVLLGQDGLARGLRLVQ